MLINFGGFQPPCEESVAKPEAEIIKEDIAWEEKRGEDNPEVRRPHLLQCDYQIMKGVAVHRSDKVG